MAKRSNNIRNKRSIASKPYDVSNSFVKKVASRVSELLPQSIWPTKWFSSTNNEEPTLGKGRDALNSPIIAEEETNECPIPTKRARIPLNSSYSEPLIESTNPDQDFEIRLRHPLPSINVTEDGLDEPIAGPSGLQRHYSPMGNSESSVLKSRDSLIYAAKKREVNGEDHSDSSESTSGCSSLPLGDQNTEVRNVSQSQSKEPQVECPESGARASVKRRFSETANYNSMAANSSRLFSGLGGYSPPNRTPPLPVGRRRKPSFNPDAFGLQSWSGEKTNIKDRIVNSPFYSGRTTYGGVSAYQTSLKKTENQTLPRRKSIQVQPKNVSESRENSTSMSSTARRIMEALEMFSSPIQDAKKIPLDESIHIKRRKVLVNPDFSQSFSHSSQSSHLTMQDSMARRLGDVPPPVKELTIPTVPDILALRRLQRLQGSTAAARQAACEKNILPPSVEKDNHSDSLHPSYPDIRSSGRVGGKIKSNEEIDEEPVEEVNLPNIALPITSLPKFDFIVPPACPPQSAPKLIDSQSVSKQNNSLSFKFSSPIAFSGASEMLTTSNSFTFSSPLKALSKDLAEKSPKISPCSSTDNIKSISNINDKLTSHVKGRSSSIENLPPLEPIWLSKGKDLNVRTDGSGAKKAVDNFQMSSGNSSSEKSSFGDKFKPAAGSWECDTCMVRNNNDVSKCVACETQRISVAGDSKSTKVGPTVSSGFGSSFKPPSGSWTCDTCLVQNPSTTGKCLACETPKAGKDALDIETPKADSNVAVSGFGDKFKKPSGDWDCSICLVRNKAGGPLKCVACEAPKPGTEPAPSSGPKFTFGSPVVSGFNFGIDKADLPKKDKAVETPKPSFTFGNASTVPAGGFMFGVNNASEVPKSNAGGVMFGITSITDTADSSKKSIASESTPIFSFGVKSSCENNQKTASAESEGVKPDKDVEDDSSNVTKAKVSAESDVKFISGTNSNTVLPGFVMPAVTTKLPTTSDAKSSPFASPDISKREPATSSGTFSFGGNSAMTKPSDPEKKSPSTAFSTPSSTANITSGSGWASNSPFKLDSSPKASMFNKTASPLGSLGKSSDKTEETSSPGTSAFKFGGASKAESTSSKVPEVPVAVSSNFKFQEPPKTTAAFKVEETTKNTSVTLPSVSTSTFTSNPFSSGGFGSVNKEKLPVSSSFGSTASVPASIPLSNTADSSAVKASNAGSFAFGKPSTSDVVPSVSSDSSVNKPGNAGLFMFGSGNSSQATAFNVTKQKQTVPTTSSSISTEPTIPPLMSSAGSTHLFGNAMAKPTLFENVMAKSSLFGSQTTTPSPSSTTSLLSTTKSETLNPSSNVFASPAATSMFGSSVSSSATTTTAAVATTTAGSSSSAFGSSIFGSASTSFSAVGSSAPAPAFGSSTTTPLAAPPAFGVRQSSPSVFGIGSSASAATPFSFTAKPATEEQQRRPASNAPFVFGGGAAVQPFNFDATPSKPPFSFGSTAAGSQPVIGAGAPPSVASTAPGGFSFGDVSKGATPFGSTQPTTSIAGGTSNPFASNPTAPVASVTPAAPAFGAPLGENNAAAGGTFGSTPAFNFGSSQSNPVFAFSNNQANAAPAPAFNFGQAPQQSATPQVTFNPNMPPSFNFTGGATPQFTATPGSLGSVPAANPMQRRIKKAVRRSQQPR